MLTPLCASLRWDSPGRKGVDIASTERPVDVDEPAILIKIPQLFRHGMSDVALYEATRGTWRVGPRREGAQYALTVHEGIVREVYTIERWQPAGTAGYTTRAEPEHAGRWEFVGRRAPDAIRSKYVGGSVKHYFTKGNQNPVRYVNC